MTLSARERRWFWTTLPSKTFLLALVSDAIVGTILTCVGLPDLKPLPWWQTVAVFVYAMVACFVNGCREGRNDQKPVNG